MPPCLSASVVTVNEGKILAAGKDGAYVLRLEGDVRLTLCTTIDEYLQAMLEDPAFVSVAIDLCAAEGIDSTTLGLLAKLALQVRERFGFAPAIYSCEPGINRLLKSMGFQRIFELHETACDGETPANLIPMKPGSEGEVRDKVIEAHRVLMSLSEENRSKFKDLLAALECG